MDRGIGRWHNFWFSVKFSSLNRPLFLQGHRNELGARQKYVRNFDRSGWQGSRTRNLPRKLQGDRGVPDKIEPLLGGEVDAFFALIDRLNELDQSI